MSESPKAKRNSRTRLINRWIDSLLLGPPLGDSDVCVAVSNGLLLVKIIERLVPEHEFIGIYDRPLTKRPCIINIEKAFEVIYRKVPASKIPSADEIYSGTSRSITLLSEIFDAFVMSEVRSKFNNVALFFKSCAKEYSFDFSSDELLIYPFPFILAVLDQHSQEQPSKSYLHPRLNNASKDLEQISHCLTLLSKDLVPLYLTPKEWLSFPDTDFVMLQLYLIYLRYSPSSFNPALFRSPIISPKRSSLDNTSPELPLRKQSSPPSPEILDLVDFESEGESFLDEEQVETLTKHYQCCISKPKTKTVFKDSIISVDGLPDDNESDEVNIALIYLVYFPVDPVRLSSVDLQSKCDRISVCRIVKIKKLDDDVMGVMIKEGDQSFSLNVSFYTESDCNEFYAAFKCLLNLLPS
ncbi:hypothetical protein GEMRC1_001459 [Eukaryota sp. GEM-RC1]